MTSRARSKAERFVAEHRDEVRRYLDLIPRFDAAAWEAPYAPGKWSPAQVSEHVVRYYEAALEALAGRAQLRPRIGRLGLWLSRRVVLPHILFHRSIPTKVRAPRELQAEAGLPPGPAAQRISELTVRFENDSVEAERTGDRFVIHPYFGRLLPTDFLRFSTVHLKHHREQIASALPPTGR